MRFFKCEMCGNFIELLRDGGGELVCCGESMTELFAKASDEGLEKHVPVATFSDGKLVVKVGEIEHPMTEQHFITTIIIEYNNKVQRVNLKYSDKPEAEFTIDEDFDKVEIYEYCNIHGLWKNTFTK